MNAIEAHALAATVEERIRVLWAERKWWRQHRWADWPDIRHDHDVQLRELVRLARQARKIAAAAPDPMDRYKSLADWTESEKAEAFA